LGKLGCQFVKQLGIPGNHYLAQYSGYVSVGIPEEQNNTGKSPGRQVCPSENRYWNSLKTI
jgi:hypothetical protein